MRDPRLPVLNPKVMKVSEQIRRGIMPHPMKERRHHRPSCAFDFMPGSTVWLTDSKKRSEEVFGTDEELDDLVNVLLPFRMIEGKTSGTWHDAFERWMYFMAGYHPVLIGSYGLDEYSWCYKVRYRGKEFTVGVICEPDRESPRYYAVMMRRFWLERDKLLAEKSPDPETGA